MKRILSLLFLIFALSFVAEAQEGTSRNFWYSPIRVRTNNITPKPTKTYSQLGNVGGKWAEVTNEQWGTVTTTTTAGGLVTVPVTVQAAGFKVLVTPETTLAHYATINATTDTTFVVKFWLNNAVVNAGAVKFHWQLKE